MRTSFISGLGGAVVGGLIGMALPEVMAGLPHWVPLPAAIALAALCSMGERIAKWRRSRALGKWDSLAIYPTAPQLPQLPSYIFDKPNVYEHLKKRKSQLDASAKIDDLSEKLSRIVLSPNCGGVDANCAFRICGHVVERPVREGGGVVDQSQGHGRSCRGARSNH